MMDGSIGIDISKDNLDVPRLSDEATAQFANTSAGFRDLTKWLGTERPARVVYEPTGPCYGAFEKRFAGWLPLVKVNPLQARHFAQSKGLRAKIDKAAALMLALMRVAFALKQAKAPPGPDHPPVARYRRRNQRLHCAGPTNRPQTRHPEFHPRHRRRHGCGHPH